MSQISQLLLYQEKDSELLKIELEIANSKERKNYVQTRNFMRKASEKLDQLDAKSKELVKRLAELEASYKEIEETLKDFEHVDELLSGGGDLSFYKRNAEQLSERFKTLKADIQSVSAAAKATSDEYKQLKQKVIAAQKQYADIDKAYKDLKTKYDGEMQKIKEELNKLCVGIDENILKKYQMKRSERIFPIICEITAADRCSKCGTELSIADKDKISSGTVIECERCGRFLYKKQ